MSDTDKTRKQQWTRPGEAPSVLQPGVVDIRSLGFEDLDVVFQPIVDLATGRTFANEALVRCRVPGLQSPPALFALAEEQRACGPLGRRIREVAFERCQDAALFVNIHPEELSSHWLVRPDDPLVFHGRDVYLEITEVAAFTHFKLCMHVLREICVRTGAHLVVDDFGAGYSNLERVLDLNPAVVKLDIALIKGIERNHRKQILVKHIVALCVDLGARVVAEGIEHLAELETLIELGVHFGQGYFLARPAYPVPVPEWAPPRAGRLSRPTPWAPTEPPPRAMRQRTSDAPPRSARPRVPSAAPRGAPPLDRGLRTKARQSARLRASQSLKPVRGPR